VITLQIISPNSRGFWFLDDKKPETGINFDLTFFRILSVEFGK